MSRHTKSDGKTPDERITSVDEHEAELGPSPTLIGDYYKRGLAWKDFAELYLAEIRAEPKCALVKALAARAVQENITILCIEESDELCHRRLLAEECQKYEQDLRVVRK